MAKFKDTVITNLGMAVLTNLINGDMKANYQHVFTSTQNLTGMENEDIKGLASLNDHRQSVAVGITSIEDAKNQVSLGAVFTNKNVAKDYNIESIGWTVLDKKGQEILFAVTPLATPEIMPADDGTGSSFFTIYPELVVAVSDVGKVSATVQAGGTVTQAQLESGLASKAEDADVVHDNHDGSIKVNKNDIYPVIDNKDGSVTVNGLVYVPADKANVVHDNHDGSVVINDRKMFPADISNVKNILDQANSYTDDGDKQTLEQANSVANAGDKTTLSQAKEAISTGDSQTLTSAKNYADSKATNYYTKSESNNRYIQSKDTGWIMDGITLLNGAKVFSDFLGDTPAFRIIQLGSVDMLMLSGSITGIAADETWNLGLDVVALPQLVTDWFSEHQMVNSNFNTRTYGNQFGWFLTNGKIRLTYCSGISDRSWVNFNHVFMS